MMIVILGKLCIEVKSTDKIAFISEFLCIGCGICVKKCVASGSFSIQLLTPSADALLRLLLSSTCPQTWSPKSHIDTLQMHSSFTVFLHHDQDRCLVSSELTVSERVPLSKSSQESSSPTSVATMYAQLTAFPRIACSLYSGSPRLARNLEVLPWIRTSKLLHESA